MKKYLNFTLTGSQFLPVWIAFFLFFMIPYFLLKGELTALTAADVPAGGPSKLFFLYLSIVIIMAFIFIYTVMKLVIQSLEYNGLKMICDFHPGKYVGIVVTGLVLSIATLGIHIPWFIKKIHRFFVHGASYNAHKFAFRGKGSKLFLIMTLTISIPFLLVGFVVFTVLKSDVDIWVYQLFVMFSLVPNIYLIYKWLIDIRYKDYLIAWDTEFFPAIGKIAIELGLGVITFGIYFPLTYIRLYRYFLAHTKSNVVGGKQITMGYDGDQLTDFLYIWGQILLTVVTLGFYYPWAFSKIIRRVLVQTYLTTEIPSSSELK